VELYATPKGMIHWRSPGPLPQSIRQLLITHKAELLALLPPAAPLPITPTDLPVDWQLHWDERAAIMEHDGRMTRE
jgi:hypothetical protein